MSHFRSIFVPGAESEQQPAPKSSLPPVDPSGASALTTAPPKLIAEDVPARQQSISSSAAGATAMNLGSGALNKVELAKTAAVKIGALKKWTISSLKNTKQSVYEHLGKVDKTVDVDLETRIADLRELATRYGGVLALARQFIALQEQSNDVQRSLAESLYQLAAKEEMIKRELSVQSETFRGAVQQGESLVRCLTNFSGSMDTLTDKTIADCLLTIDHHDLARLEYDVSRHELEGVRSNPGSSAQAIDEAEAECKLKKHVYEQLKDDVRVKMTLLEENRYKVMRQQIKLVHTALSAHATGNAELLRAQIWQLDNLAPGGRGGHRLRSTNSSEERDDDEDPMALQQQRPGSGADKQAGHAPSFLEN